MIPQTLLVDQDSSELLVLPSLTYKLDFDTGRIIGTIDGKAALVQAVDKLFSTARYAYEIYDGSYGQEFNALVGKSTAYAIAEIPRMAEECLLQDDRILKISDFEISQEAIDSLSVSFHVYSIYGEFTYVRGGVSV